MSNNLAGLNAKLATQLRDTSNKTWASAELDDLITWSVARLASRHLKTLAHADVTQALTSGTYYYTLDSSIHSLVRVDLVDSDGNEFGPLPDGTWETHGDPNAGTFEIHVAPTIVDNIGGTLRYVGYQRYDTSSVLIPDELVPLVLARARAEALRRVLTDRERYKAWAAQSQQSNTSVNEMTQMVSEAEAESSRLNGERRTWRKPMPGRV